MFDFLNIKISTLTGIIVLLLVVGAVGAMIFYQFYQLMTIRFEVIELKINEDGSRPHTKRALPFRQINKICARYGVRAR